jgi:hypothetical protein
MTEAEFRRNVDMRRELCRQEEEYCEDMLQKGLNE